MNDRKSYMKNYRQQNKNKFDNYKLKYKSQIEELKENKMFVDDCQYMFDQFAKLKLCFCVYCGWELCNKAIKIHLVNKHKDNYKP